MQPKARRTVAVTKANATHCKMDTSETKGKVETAALLTLRLPLRLNQEMRRAKLRLLSSETGKLCQKRHSLQL